MLDPCQCVSVCNVVFANQCACLRASVSKCQCACLRVSKCMSLHNCVRCTRMSVCAQVIRVSSCQCVQMSTRMSVCIPTCFKSERLRATVSMYEHVSVYSGGRPARACFTCATESKCCSHPTQSSITFSVPTKYKGDDEAEEKDTEKNCRKHNTKNTGQTDSEDKY